LRGKVQRSYISHGEIDSYLRAGKAGAVLVFAPDYDRGVAQMDAGIPIKPLVRLVVDASNVNTAGSATCIS
jgi:hypothetical protein